MQKLLSYQKVTINFIIIGVLAIIIGGLRSAFLAHQPTEIAMWTSAYLVLVTGVAQVGFGLFLYKLARPKMASILWLALLLYNIGNIDVIAGTMYKTMSLGQTLVNAGGVSLVLALVCMLVAVDKNKRSWLLYGFYLVTLTILISIPIGLWLVHS